MATDSDDTGAQLAARIARLAAESAYIGSPATFADGSGVWHAAITVRAGKPIEPALLARMAAQAIRRELDVRGGRGPGYRVRVDLHSATPSGDFAVTLDYRERA